MSNKKRISRFEKEKTSLDEIKSLRLKVWSQQLENAMLRAQIAIVSSQPKANSYAPGGWGPTQKREFKIIGETGTPEILSTFNGKSISKGWVPVAEGKAFKKMESINNEKVGDQLMQGFSTEEYEKHYGKSDHMTFLQFLMLKSEWTNEDFKKQYLSNPINKH